MTRFKIDNIHKRYPNRNIGFKATNHDMTCRGYEYSLGQRHTHEGQIEVCNSGFHLCSSPTQTLQYYNNLQGDKRFFIVEYGQDYMENEHAEKIVTKELTLLEEINILEYIQDNIDSITRNDWLWISMNQKLSEEFIIQHKDRLNWNYISSYQQLSEEFIRQYQGVLDWTRLSIAQKLSEEFMREFKDKVNWYRVSTHQRLSEDLIRDFKDKVHWENILQHQKLSEKFLDEFKYTKINQ